MTDGSLPYEQHPQFLSQIRTHNSSLLTISIKCVSVFYIQSESVHCRQVTSHQVGEGVRPSVTTYKNNAITMDTDFSSLKGSGHQIFIRCSVNDGNSAALSQGEISEPFWQKDQM